MTPGSTNSLMNLALRMSLMAYSWGSGPGGNGVSVGVLVGPLYFESLFSASFRGSCYRYGIYCKI